MGTFSVLEYIQYCLFFQEVIEELKELGGGKVDTRKSLLFHNDGNNMAVSLKDVSDGWNLSQQCEKDVVSIITNYIHAYSN